MGFEKYNFTVFSIATKYYYQVNSLRIKLNKILN